jgi:hypothetical protein
LPITDRIGNESIPIENLIENIPKKKRPAKSPKRSLRDLGAPGFIGFAPNTKYKSSQSLTPSETSVEKIPIENIPELTEDPSSACKTDSEGGIPVQGKIFLEQVFADLRN